MSDDILYDVIVVGAGVEGSSTAYNLAKDNVNTLLLDQYPLPHTRGSSHGQTRGIRMAYTEEWNAKLMPTAYKMWATLEKEENVKLYFQTGLLTLDQKAPGDSPNLRSMVESLRQINAPYEILTQAEIVRRFPAFRLDPSQGGVYDPRAGLLRADKALHCLWNQFRAHGGTLHDGEPVVRITPGHVVTVTTTDASYRGHSVVLCAGPWTNRLTAPLGLHLPLKAQRLCVLHWKVKTDHFSIKNNMPNLYVYNSIMGGKEAIFAHPSFEYPNHYKLCAHFGEEIDPENRDSQKALETNRRIIESLKEFVKEYLPGLEPEPSIQEACIYTNTPDEDFILDRHPQFTNMIVGAGFSGHGFKMGPVVGRILADLATGRKPAFDIKPFGIKRFSQLNAQL